MAGCNTKRMAKGGMAMGAGRGYRRGGKTEIEPKMSNPRPRVKTDMPRARVAANPMSNPMSNPRPPRRYKVGGKVRGDGICKKGHTKGRMV